MLLNVDDDKFSKAVCAQHCNAALTGGRWHLWQHSSLSSVGWMLHLENSLQDLPQRVGNSSSKEGVGRACKIFPRLRYSNLFLARETTHDADAWTQCACLLPSLHSHLLHPTHSCALTNYYVAGVYTPTGVLGPHAGHCRAAVEVAVEGVNLTTKTCIQCSERRKAAPGSLGCRALHQGVHSPCRPQHG